MGISRYRRGPRQAPIDDDVIVLEVIERKHGVGFARATPDPLQRAIARAWRLQQQAGVL